MATKKTSKAEEVKTEAVVAEEKAVETPAKAEEKTAAKKTATKKTTTKASEKKAETEEKKVVIQYNGGEISGAELIEKAKANAKATHGVKIAKKIDVYVKPEVNKVYYVINGDICGDFDLF